MAQVAPIVEVPSSNNCVTESKIKPIPKPRKISACVQPLPSRSTNDDTPPRNEKPIASTRSRIITRPVSTIISTHANDVANLTVRLVHRPRVGVASRFSYCAPATSDRYFEERDENAAEEEDEEDEKTDNKLR